MFEQNGQPRRPVGGQPELAVRVHRLRSEQHDAVGNLPRGNPADGAAEALRFSDAAQRPVPAAWKLVPRNKAYVETCTFYSQREAFAHAEDFDCELVPLFEHPGPAPHRVRAVLLACADVLGPTTEPESAELRIKREAAYQAAIALLQEVNHG